MQLSLSPELEARLASPAARQGRDVEALAKEAIERLIDFYEWFLAEVAKGRVAAKRASLSGMKTYASRSTAVTLADARPLDRTAVRDLTAICDYIEQHDSPLAARYTESLVRFPRRGRLGSEPGTREFVLVGSPWLA